MPRDIVDPPELLLVGPRVAARRRTAGPRPWVIAGVVVALMVATPILAVLHGAASPSGPVWRLLADTVLGEFIANSIMLGGGVVLLATLIGATTAWLVTMHAFPGRGAFEIALLLPLAMPAYLIGYVYTDLLEVAGPVQSWLRTSFDLRFGEYWFPQIRSLPGAIVMFALVLYPYVYLLARAAFIEQSVCLTEVARTLGCSRLGMIRRVAMPLARPAIVGGAALVLMEVLADFATVQHFAVRTFTTGIYQAWFEMADRSAAQQLAACLVGAIALVLVLERTLRGPRRYHGTSSRHQALERSRLGAGAAGIAVLACLMPVTFGFVLPAAVLVMLGVAAGDPIGMVLPFAGNSLVVSGLAALVVVGVALLLVYGLRLSAEPLMRLSVRVAGLGYAVPGSVIAVGVLVPFGLVDNAIDFWARERLGVSTGLLLSGTIAGLVFAYLVRFLAVGLSTIEAGVGRIRPVLDDAARVLGHGPGRTLRWVHLPLLRGSLVSAAVLVLVDAMKELPATLIVRPFDFDTLAVRVYNLASDERLAQASTAALMIVAAGLVPVAVLARAMKRTGSG